MDAVWEGLRVERRGDGTARAIEIAHPVAPQAIRAALQHYASRGLESLQVANAAWLPLDALARPSLRELRVAIQYAHYLHDARPAAAACDVRALLDAMPQLERLAVSARSVHCTGSVHPGLRQLVLVVDALPAMTGCHWPAVTAATLQCDGAEVADAEALCDALPALAQLSLHGRGAATMFGVLPARLPAPVRAVTVHGTIPLPVARAVMAAPGRLDGVERVAFEASGPSRIWLDCLAGKPAARARKRARVERWLEMFETLDALPPAIVVEGGFAFWPHDPLERDLRAATDRDGALVYADWLEQRGHGAAATALRDSPLLATDPLRAIELANEEHRESFREATLVLLEAWRRRSPHALATGEPTEAFRGRMHAKLMAFSFARDVRRDPITTFLDADVQARLGPIAQWVQLYDGVLAIAAANGYGLVVERPLSLHPDHAIRAGAT